MRANQVSVGGKSVIDGVELIFMVFLISADGKQ